jgi:hypothetical protein
MPGGPDFDSSLFRALSKFSSILLNSSNLNEYATIHLGVRLPALAVRFDLPQDIVHVEFAEILTLVAIVPRGDRSRWKCLLRVTDSQNEAQGRV